MNKKRYVKLVSVLVTTLLVVSTFGVLFGTATASNDIEDRSLKEDTSTETKKEQFSVDESDLPTEEELQQRIKKLMKEGNLNEKRLNPDMMDPEKMKDVMGESSSEEQISSAGGGNDLRTDEDTKDQHHVDEVHNMGYKGDGVKVSFMDTGFDMAQPDIRGKHARYEWDPTKPAYLKQYDGYPIAFDPMSMADYTVSGEPDESTSWFVDTSYETQAHNTSNMGKIAYYDEKPSGDNLYKLPDFVSDGDMIRFGMHPDDALYEMYGEKPALLLTQNSTGAWTNVTVDLDNDRSFRDETPAMINGAARDSEVISQDVNEDGIGDISGGMVTFVSNLNNSGQRMPLPYSQHYRDSMNALINLKSGVPPGYIEAIYGVDAWDFILGDGTPGSAPYHDKPAPGDLVCLMGDFNGPGSMGAHGTWTASAVVGQGVTGEPGSSSPPDPAGGSGIVQGLAPNATIIPMGHFFEYPNNNLALFDSGYVSTMFSAQGFDGDASTHYDQAQIASSSFGNSYPVNVGGHNYYDRLMDYVGTYESGGNTLFVNSEGNEGSGFGSMGAPAGGQNILSVGASSNMYYRVDEWYQYDGGPNPWYGDVTSMSSRGPDNIGAHGPDVMANGQFGYGGDPLNNHAYSFGAFGGEDAYYLWSGTSLSAPNAAGVATLVYQAFYDSQGTRPTASMVKEMIMQGADNLNNSVFAQGAGMVNASKSVKMAILEDGMYVPNTEDWRPGTNPTTGASTDHNANIMKPGDTQLDKFTLRNHNSTDQVNYEIKAKHLEKTGENSIELDSGTTDLSDYGYPYGTGPQPILIINHTGMWYPNGTYAGPIDTTDSDLYRFGVHTDYSEIKEIDPAFGIQRQAFLEFHDWTDVNANGTYEGFSERNRIGYTWIAQGSYAPDQTSSYMDIHNMLERAHDGVVLRARPEVVAPEEFGGGPIPFTLNIDQYNETTWDWISIDNATGSINTLDAIDFNLSVTVPQDAPMGFYEGKVMIENTDNGDTSVIPVTVNVGSIHSAADSKNLNYKFGSGSGNSTYNTGVYRNDRVYGSWSGLYPRSGDWRYYYFHLNDATDGPVAMNLNYDDPLSEVEAYLLSDPGVTPDTGDYVDAFSGWIDPGRYGNYQLEVYGSTQDYSGEVGMLTDDPLEPGMYMVAVHSKQISGHDDYQEFGGEIYVPGSVTPDRIHEEYNITSASDVATKTSGQYPMVVDAGADYDNITTNVTGPQKIVQTTMTGTTNPANGGTDKEYFVNYAVHKEIECVGVEKLTITLSSTAEDLDLGLLLDDGDGEPDMDDTLVATSATASSDEQIELDFPTDGLYFIAVNTWSGSAGVPFNLDVEQYYTVNGTFAVDDVPDNMTAGDTVLMNITYDLPAQHGAYSGMVSIGRPGSALGIVIPIRIKLNDRLPGTLTRNSTMSTMNITEPSHNIVFDYDDPTFYSGMDTATVYIDGYTIPTEAYMIDNINDQITVHDVYSNVASGDHSITMMVNDTGGNSIWSSTNYFNVDHSVTPFEINMMDGATEVMPGETTGANSLSVEGVTQVWDTGERSTVIINDETVTVDATGAFSKSVTLSHGYNMITISSTNPYGTTEEKSYVVHADLETELTVNDPPSLTASSSITVSGSTEIGSSLTVNDNNIAVDPDGTFSGSVSLSEGENILTFTTTDSYGNTKTVTKTVTSDTTAPTISDVTAPSETTSSTATVSGTVDDADADVYVNGYLASSEGSTSFSANINLAEGNNTVKIVAEDEAGNSATEELTITYTSTYATQDDISETEDSISDSMDSMETSLTTDISGLSDKLGMTESSLIELIHTSNNDLNDNINNTQTDLEGEIDNSTSSLNERLDTQDSTLDGLSSDTEELKENDEKLKDNDKEISDMMNTYAIVLIILIIIGLAGVAFMLNSKINGVKDKIEETEEPMAEDIEEIPEP